MLVSKYILLNTIPKEKIYLTAGIKLSLGSAWSVCLYVVLNCHIINIKRKLLVNS